MLVESGPQKEGQEGQRASMEDLAKLAFFYYHQMIEKTGKMKDEKAKEALQKQADDMRNVAGILHNMQKFEGIDNGDEALGTIMERQVQMHQDSELSVEEKSKGKNNVYNVIKFLEGNKDNPLSNNFLENRDKIGKLLEESDIW